MTGLCCFSPMDQPELLIRRRRRIRRRRLVTLLELWRSAVLRTAARISRVRFIRGLLSLFQRWRSLIGFVVITLDAGFRVRELQEMCFNFLKLRRADDVVLFLWEACNETLAVVATFECRRMAHKKL